MQTISLIWGILAFLGMLFGFLPCLGAFNWLNIPFAAIGFIFSLYVYNKETTLARGGSKTGMVLCAIAAIVGLMRLYVGFGVL
jgi:hypothetical protein